MKPYATWARFTSDRAYNCHCCGHLICQGDPARAYDVFRVHEACVRQGTFSQLVTGLSEAQRMRAQPPEHVRCVACGERPDAVYGLEIANSAREEDLRLRAVMVCGCGAQVEFSVSRAKHRMSLRRVPGVGVCIGAPAPSGVGVAVYDPAPEDPE